jgi:dimethylamine/trimethylamine dehydrogenase
VVSRPERAGRKCCSPPWNFRGELDVPGVYTPDDLAAGTWFPRDRWSFSISTTTTWAALSRSAWHLKWATTYVTPAGNASAWTFMTNELPLVHRALAKARCAHPYFAANLGLRRRILTLADVYSGAEKIACRSVVMVGMRKPRQELYDELMGRGTRSRTRALPSITRIGDARSRSHRARGPQRPPLCARVRPPSRHPRPPTLETSPL